MHDVGMIKYFTPMQNKTSQAVSSSVKLTEDTVKSVPKNRWFLMMKTRRIKLPSKVKLQTMIPGFGSSI